MAIPFALLMAMSKQTNTSKLLELKNIDTGYYVPEKQIESLPPIYRNEKCEKECEKNRFSLDTDPGRNMMNELKSTNKWLKVQGIHLLNQNMKVFMNLGVEECKYHCENTRECESIVYTELWGNSTCWLKKSAQNYLLDSDMVSYVKIPPMYQCFPNLDFYGDNIFSANTSYNNCTELCNKERKACNGFTWVLNNVEEHGQCFLKILPYSPKAVADPRGAITCYRSDATEATCQCAIS
jgi:hypothetical protein